MADFVNPFEKKIEAPEVKPKVEPLQVKSQPASEETKEPSFKDLQVKIFKAGGFIIIQYHNPPYYNTLTKKQAKEFARLLIKESL